MPPFDPVAFVQRALDAVGASDAVGAKARPYDGPHPRRDDVHIDHAGGRDMIAGDVLRAAARRGEAGDAWLRDMLRRLL